MTDPYFFGYQKRWLEDSARLKISAKSRRIGMTYVQAYEDVRDCVTREKYDVWFSSADESAALEYTRYAMQWATLFDVAARDLDEEVLVQDGQKQLARLVKFANGSRITALRSNPSALRSKGGKIVLDEYAHHEHQAALWAAARPVATWGFPIRILSTYNGRKNKFYQFASEQSDAGATAFSRHETTIYDAVNQGLADRIVGRTLTEVERAAWIAAERAACHDESVWQQEYCCQPLDEASAYLSYDLIVSCESSSASEVGANMGTGPIYVGMDIARRRHLSVIWVVEQVEDVLVTRAVVALRAASFAEQDAALATLMDRYGDRVQRVCIDQTGIGERSVETYRTRWGERIEGVLFSGAVNQSLAMGLRRTCEDRRIRIPSSREIRDDLHAVRQYTTTAGNVRFDAEATDAGHADRFWACALAVHAAAAPARVPRVRAL